MMKTGPGKLALFKAPHTAEDFVFRPRGEPPVRGQKYVGPKCGKCGSPVRYTSNTHCVNCQTDGEARWQRKNRNISREVDRRIARAIKLFESW